MFVGWLVHHVIPEISSITGWIATNVCTYSRFPEDEFGHSVSQQLLDRFP